MDDFHPPVSILIGQHVDVRYLHGPSRPVELTVRVLYDIVNNQMPDSKSVPLELPHQPLSLVDSQSLGDGHQDKLGISWVSHEIRDLLGQSLPAFYQVEEGDFFQLESITDLEIEPGGHAQMFDEFVGQIEKAQGVASRGCIPNDQVVLPIFDPLQNIVQHELFLDTGRYGHVVYDLIVLHVNKGGSRLVNLRAKLFLPPLHHFFGADFQGMKVLYALHRLLCRPHLHFKYVREGRGEVAGDDQRFSAQRGIVEGCSSRTGRLSHPPFPSEHEHALVSVIQIRKGHRTSWLC